MKKILLTGASGFIGGYLAEEAVLRNYELYACVRKTSNPQYLLDPRISFIELDLLDVPDMEKKIAEAPVFDYVIHNAGLTKGLKKENYFESNYLATRNLIDVLIRLKKVPEKFIYMSSLAAYGPGIPSQPHPVKSSDTPGPLTHYGKSKLEAERYLESLKGFPYIIIRPTVVYGPREKDLLTVFKLINLHLEVFVGFKRQAFTFVYVRDLVKAVFQLMEANVVNKGYFISDGHVYGRKMLGGLIKKHLDKKTLRIYLPLVVVKFLSGIVEASKYFSHKQPALNLDKVNELAALNWRCDNQPLVEDIQFIPEYNLDQGIKETISWYRQAKWLK
jgi:nucleoside-diphosphate-sugar epimerase